jgi:hypothetical protein
VKAKRLGDETVGQNRWAASPTTIRSDKELASYEELSRKTLGAVLAPVAEFFQAFIAGLFEKPHAVPAMLELMNVGPDLGAPVFFMSGRFAAGGATGVQTAPDTGHGWGQLDENAAHFLNFFFFSDDVLIAEDIAETKFAGFQFGFRTGMEWAILGPQLLS